MIHTRKTTPFFAYGAEWELVSFAEMPDQVFVRMVKPGGSLAFDGKLRTVRFKPKGEKSFPCFYIKTVEERGSKTICVPIREWREHHGEL